LLTKAQKSGKLTVENQKGFGQRLSQDQSKGFSNETQL